MKRLVLLNVVACLLAASLFTVGCSTQKKEIASDNPWPPDTVWLVKNSGSEYIVYEKWPPDTMAASVEVSSMSGTHMMAASRVIDKKTSSTERLEVFPPWPPDTMRFIFKNFRDRSGAVPGIR